MNSEEYNDKLDFYADVIDGKLMELKKAVNMIDKIYAWALDPSSAETPAFTATEYEFLLLLLGKETAAEVSELYYLTYNLVSAK
jgi:hypothetical protein